MTDLVSCYYVVRRGSFSNSAIASAMWGSDCRRHLNEQYDSFGSTL